MDLRMALRVLLRHKWIMLIGLVAGIALAVLSLYSINVRDSRVEFTRRSTAVYTATVPVLVDLPGFGLGRTDVPMDKPARMAPTFAYLVTSQDVLERVTKEIGPIPKEDKVTAVEVEDSPLFQVIVEGNDPKRVSIEAMAFAKAVTDYVVDRQESSGVLEGSRLVLSPLGNSAPPVEVQSRDVEIAAILLMLPIMTAGGIAFVLENLSNSSANSSTPSVASSSGGRAPDKPITREVGGALETASGSSAGQPDDRAGT